MAPTQCKPADTKTTLKSVQSKITAFKVTKPGVQRRSKKAPKALQRPVLPPGDKYKTRILANGLVDVKNIPDFLVAAVKRNAKESALLRLPGSIRKTIWQYTMGGASVVVLLKSNDDLKKSPQANSTSLYRGKAAEPGNPRKNILTAFRLPQVCRQIYAETATLGYALNAFVFAGEVESSFGLPEGPDGALEGWRTDRIPAQISAITAIRPHWLDLLKYLSRENKRTFRQLYPNLKQLRVPKRMVNYEAKWVERGDPMRRYLRQQARERIIRQIKELEGKDVEVVF